MPVPRQQRVFYKSFSQHGSGAAMVEIEPKDVVLLIHIAYLDIFENEPDWFSKTISLQRQIFQVICTSPRPTRILSISASTTVSLSSMSILSQSFIYPLMVSMFRFPYISADI